MRPRYSASIGTPGNHAASSFPTAVQYIGLAKNANPRAAVNLELEGNEAKLGVAVTEVTVGAVISLQLKSNEIYKQTADMTPGQPFITSIVLPDGCIKTDLLLRVCDANGHELIRYRPQLVEKPELPESKTPPPPPETFETIEELYLAGLHLEQYRHPTIEPEPYWEAALAKDPTDTRCNNAMGLVHFRRGNFDLAIKYFQKAIDKLTRRNPNPRNGEVLFNLGMALKYKGDLETAYDAFYKAIWSYAWQAPGYYALAELDCLRSDFATALEHVERSLVTNALNMKARNLKTAVLRKLGRFAEAASFACETVGLDPLDMWSRNEIILQSRDQDKSIVAAGQLEEVVNLMHVSDLFSETQAYFDLAFDYANAGFWEEARDVLSRQLGDEYIEVNPMMIYALGYYAHQLGEDDKALKHIKDASALPVDYCFPARLEEMVILEYARELLPQDGRIAYYLGNLYYDKKRYDEAIAGWDTAVREEPDFSIPWRNLGIAAYNVQKDTSKALACYQKAFNANPLDGRLLSEYDQLLQRTGTDAETRLARLESHLDLVRARDDLSVVIAHLYNQTGQPQKALDYMLSRRYHPWEGGTGSISAQYVAAHVLLGRSKLDNGDSEGALVHFETALDTYPENLGERKHLLWPDAHVHYYKGLAQQASGDETGAEKSFNQVIAAKGRMGSVSYFQALALRAMGQEKQAIDRLVKIKERVKQQLEEQAKQGFATSIPQFVFSEADLQTRRRIYLNYEIGLAYLGLGEKDSAKAAFTRVVKDDPGHYEAQTELRKL